MKNASENVRYNKSCPEAERNSKKERNKQRERERGGKKQMKESIARVARKALITDDPRMPQKLYKTMFARIVCRCVGLSVYQSVCLCVVVIVVSAKV